MIIVKGGVTAPKGFLANGIRAGIKKSGRADLALIYSEVPAVAAGVFTTNAFRASPVSLSIANLKNNFSAPNILLILAENKVNQTLQNNLIKTLHQL